MKPAKLLILLALAGCSGTDSTPVPAAPEPAGWLYFLPSEDANTAPARIDIRTGVIKQIQFPAPYDTTRMFHWSRDRFSPINGQVTGLGFVGGVFPETFVYDPSTQSIKVFRDTDHGPFTVSADFRHVWSPDGTKIAFTRHQTSGCCEVLALLHPATGVTDTLISDDALVPSQFFWFGSDTVVIRDASFRFKSIALGSLSWSDWDLVAYFGPLPPVVSSGRNWIAHYENFDSIVAGQGAVDAWRMKLLDRRSKDDTTMVSDIVADGTIPLEATFDPDEKYLAFCTSRTTIRVYSLAERKTVKDISVPTCFGLKWSWGPEGRAADMAE